MKRLLHLFCLAAALVGVAAGFSACDTTTRNHRGGLDPEYPDDPSRPGEGGVVEETDITLKVGYGEFYGPFYNDRSDNYLITLYEGATDSEGYFTGSAHMLTLDVILPLNSDLELKAGVYSCSDADNQTFIFVPSYESKNENGETFLDGSTLYVQRDPNHYSTKAITDGRFTVRRLVTGQYQIEATIVADGAEYTFHFKGDIPIDDKVGKPDDTIQKNVVMDNITRVVAEDCGQVWEGIEATDYRDWIIYFYDKDAGSSKEYTCVEILTQDKFVGELPQMTFNKVVQVGNPKDFVPGVIIGGYTDDDNTAWGTWYCKGGTAYYAATKGTFDIKREGNGYAFTFDFVDEDETYGGTFKGSYTGQVEFTKDQSQSGAPRRSAGKLFSAKRGAAPMRTASPERSGQRARIAR